jgi:hypothetical protein
LLPDGSALVVGGSDHTGRLLASAESFDPIAGQWSDAPGLGTARSGHTATVLRDGRVLVVGGAGGPVDSHGLLASAELYGVPPPGTITPAYTGSWFDPAQSGHGLHLEVLPGNKFLAAWFTFNPAGTEQAWFLGVGDYVGNTATVTQVAQPTGGRFIPKFDPGQVVNNPWGTLKFTFSDCNHGRVDFDSVRGYGSGSMSLTRLTQPAGLGCP